ncbi:MAG: hypothetical protein NC401_19465 [Ruminococcus sp.]|nr:hypothetical protein [Ruminococcus sp.]
MTVLKEGDPDRAKQLVSKTRRFKCGRCGCVFEADKGEYQPGQQYNDVYFFCKCPCCGEQAREVRMRNTFNIK